MTVIRTDQQQDVVACRSLALDGSDHDASIRIGRREHLEMPGRAERSLMLNMVGLTQPENRERRTAPGQHLIDEAVSHAPVARNVQGDIETILGRHRHAARPEGASPVVDKSVTVGIVRVGCARRHVAEHDCSTDVLDTFRQGRDGEGVARDLPFVLKEIRIPGVARHQPAILEECYGVALKPVPGRKASGGKACRDHPGTGREYGSVILERFGLGGKSRKVGGRLSGDKISTEPVERHDDNTAHGQESAPFGATAKMSSMTCHTFSGEWFRHVRASQTAPWRSFLSQPCCPMSWTPIGNPLLPRMSGSEIVGRPHRLHGTASTPEPGPSSIRVASPGADSVTRASRSSNSAEAAAVIWSAIAFS